MNVWFQIQVGAMLDGGSKWSVMIMLLFELAESQPQIVWIGQDVKTTSESFYILPYVFISYLRT